MHLNLSLLHYRRSLRHHLQHKIPLKLYSIQKGALKHLTGNSLDCTLAQSSKLGSLSKIHLTSQGVQKCSPTCVQDFRYDR
jgi:hypothetical protein